MSEEKEEGLDTLASISEIEEYYQTLSAEVDSRALLLSSWQNTAASDLPTNDHSVLNKNFTGCVYAVRSAWQSLEDASQCMQIHLKNAANYHQFFHEIKYYDEGLSKLRVFLLQQAQRLQEESEQNTASVQTLTKQTREVLCLLLDYQAKMEQLSQLSSQVLPLRLRKDPVERPVKMTALISFRYNDISVEQNETCFLLDNSEVTKWKVRTSKGQEGSLPAIIFVIPPPDRQAVTEAQRVRQQLIASWADCLHKLKQMAQGFFQQYLDQHEARDLKCLNPGKRSEVVQCLQDLKDLLAPPHLSDPRHAQFRDSTDQWQDSTSSMSGTSPDRRGISSGLQLHWKGSQKLVRQLQEFDAYLQQYQAEVDATRQTKNCMVTDEHSDIKYCSKAYIERLKPVELQHLLPDIPEDVPMKNLSVAERIPTFPNAEEEAVQQQQLQDAEMMREDVTIESTTVATEGDVIASQTIKETQTFVIVGVIDPRNKEQLSIYRAIAEGIISQTKGVYMNPDTGESMPIPEAMNQGLILVEFTNRSVEAGELIRQGVIKTTTTKETVSYSVQSVLDPCTGARISIAEAVEKGIIDQNTGRYVNPLTGDSVAIQDAIDRGFLDVEVTQREPRADIITHDSPDGVVVNGVDVNMNGPENALMDNDLIVAGVRDPKTGKSLSLEEAIAKGVVDMEKGVYRDYRTGKEISLIDAIQRGYLKVKLADPVNDTDNTNRLNSRVLRVKTSPLQSMESLIKPQLNGGLESELPVDINTAIYEQIQGDLDPTKGCILDQKTGREMNISDAFESGVLHMDPLCVEDGAGDKYTLQEAAVMGLVDIPTARQIYKALEPYSLDKLIERGEFEPSTGQYVNPKSQKAMPLCQAIEQQQLEPKKVFYTDVPCHNVTSLSAAIDNKKWDSSTGQVLDSRTGQEMMPDKAIEKQVIDPKIDAEKLCAQISALKLLKAHMDTSLKGIRHPVTGEEVSVEQAILDGVLDLAHDSYVDPVTGQTMSIAEAVDAKLIDQDTAKQVYQAMSNSSLEEALANAQIDPNTGKFTHPETGRKMTIKEAIEKGYLDPNSIFFVDPATKKVTTIAAAIEQGKFNPTTGKFRDPLTNLEVSISNAIKKGIVNPVIQPETLIEEKASVQDMISAGKITAQNATFMAPNGQTMTLKQALASGFLTADSVVKVDPETGHVLAADGGEMLQSLLETKKHLDWLEGIETALGTQGRPSEDREELKEQIKIHQMLQKGVDKHQDPINQALQDAQELIDNNKDAKKDKGALQQYQRLKFNNSDLKLRFDAVNSQLDKRLTRLNSMVGDLDGFHGNLDNFDSWLADAGREMDDIKKSVARSDDWENVMDNFQALNSDAIAKEDEVLAVVRSGHKVQDTAKDYIKDADTFRNGLQHKVDAPDEEPSEIIEQELQATNDKFKTVIADCTTLMAKLTDTASKNKRYNELKRQLSKWLPEMETRVEKCSADVAPGGDPSKQLEEMKAVTGDVIAQGKLVDDLCNVGGDLVQILEELDCKDTPKGREIQGTVENVQTRYDQIQEEVVDKQHKLNKALVQSKDAVHNLDNLLKWTTETENLFNNMTPVSLDREALNEQIQAHRVLTSDIENHKGQVDAIVDQCQGQGEDDKVNNLLDRFDSLISHAQDRGSELEDVVQKLGTLHGNVNQLESWLANAVHSLKRESTDFDHDSLKNKIENLYRQKTAKQDDLDKIKKIGRALINDPNTGDKNRLRETLADTQAKWHDLTELLVQMISFAALREIDDLLKYLDKAENEINTAEPVSTDPETLAVQLRDHKVFHDDLEGKRKAVNDTIDKCNKMLRETTNEEADDIKNKLDTIRNQADLVCKLSTERLGLLEEALPLASHFSETHADLQSWLGEIEAEISSLDVPADGSTEQIRKHQENAKTTQRIIEDHKPLVEDLLNTGNELMDMCTDEDASDIKEEMDTLGAKYDEVRGSAREKLNLLDEAFRSVTSDVGDTLDGLLEELHYLNDQVEHADPIAASVDTLKEQINENNATVDDLERRQAAIQNTKEAIGKMLDQETPDNREECEDLKSKLQDLDKLQDNIRQETRGRATQLQEALSVAEKFGRDYREAIRALSDIQDNLASQDSPGVDPATIKEQNKELESIKDDLVRAQYPLQECRKTASHLSNLCGTPGKMEIQKYLEDLENGMEEIQDGIKERDEELTTTLDKAERFDQILQGVMSWLPKAEGKLGSMTPIAADPRSVRIQIEEMKVFRVQVNPRLVDIQNLNQYASELKNASPVTAESLTPQVKEINDRWNSLLNNTHNRERDLKDALVQLGEVDHALDEVIGFLAQTESDLQRLDYVYGDPKFIETHLKKLQLVQKDLKNQEATMKKLNQAVDQLVARSGNNTRSSPLKEKQEEMNEAYKTVQILARDRQNELQDTLKEVKGFMGDVEDLLRWCNNCRQELKSSSPMGALPDTAQKQYDIFQMKYRELEQKEDEMKALLLNGEDIIARCRDGDAVQLRVNLSKLQERMYETRGKAEKRKRKLEEHLANVRDFHAMLKIHTDWLSNAEKILGSFKHPSKLVDRVLRQIQDHKNFKLDIDGHREIMQNLDRTGTYLKYFGRKQDTVYIKNLLISIKLRWKKLVRRADEKGRLLQQAYKEDKRFYDAWKGLCDWLVDSEKRLKKYTGAASTKVKQDIDELKLFQHQLSAKHPSFYSTMRLGRSLKDRCTKTDQEREILNNMLEELKNKWNITRSIITQKQNKLDEALLSSGRISDALQSLLEWLAKAEAYLAEDQPILGDLDTVNILIEQHKAFQQELDSRQGMVAAMRSAPGTDHSVANQLDQLNHHWDHVGQLSLVRESRLQDALKMAEDFNEAVQVVREWLPHAESELKFRPLPEDEEAIVHLIEHHDGFQEDLRAQQANIERIKYLADEILQACHPNAIRFVKYYLTITQTRWEQALNRSGQRAQRLQEALRNLRGNAALIEELLAWLVEAQTLLATKEKDTIPEDLTVVEALVKEHLEFHEDLANKNKDVDRLTKLPLTGKDARKLFGSNWKLNEVDTPSPRAITLQTKWRTVWRMSVDRKKQLQDSLDTLLELESFKNFDFDLWRQRYMAWIRAKKLRITDFFRRQDKRGDGYLTRREFVEGMLVSKFPTNKTELNAVFDIFDQDRSGELDYKEFVEALRPERQRGVRTRTGKRPVTDSELIHDEIEQQVSHCQCRAQFRIQKVGEGKYKMGEKQKMCLVRFLNRSVMVRVGGGWVTFSEFLETNDPCRAKGRTNTELREQFFLPDGVAQTRAAFTTNRRRPSTPNMGTGSSLGSANSSPTGSSTSLHSTGRRPTTPSSGSTDSVPNKGRRTSTPALSRPKSPGPTRSRTPTAARAKSPAPGQHSTPPANGRVTPSHGRAPTGTGRVTPSGGRTTPSENRNPASQRSRSPSSRAGAVTPTRKFSSASRTMKF